MTEGETITKQVEFKALDDERRVAIGGVMVPNKVDRQGDWIEPGLIEEFSDGFMARLQSGDGEAVPGVMHAVFPEGHVTLAENRVLDEAQDIGGKEFPAGSWVQGWKFDDDQLWSLVKDGVLSGYSIGASGVKWSEPMSQDDLPEDVSVAEDYPADEPVRQLLAGTVGEVSSVDIPAVPDAVMVAAKAGGAKSVLDHVNGKNEFVGAMQDRGHSEDEAERLWHYLQRAIDESGKAAPAPGENVLSRIGKAAWDAITGADGDDASEKTASATDGDAEKEGRTLSRGNRDALFASIDAQLGVLDDAGVEHGATRFTDRDDVDFDLADYTGKAADAQPDENDPDGETSDSEDTTMSDDNPEIEEKLDSLIERVDELEEEQADKGTDEGGEDETPLEDKVDSLTETVETLAEQGGKSHQLSGGENGDEGRTKADLLGLPGGEA